MKNSIVTKLVLFSLISTFTLVSCEKEDNIMQHHNSKHDDKKYKPIKQKSESPLIDYADLINPENPFDSYANELQDLYSNLQDSLLNLNSPLENENQLYGVYNHYLNIYNNVLYNDIDTTNFSEYESNLLQNYFSTLTIANLIDSTIEFETRILNSTFLSSVQKDRILSISSQYKFHYLLCSNLIENYNNLKYSKSTVFRVCLGTKAQYTFADDGNPFPELQFLASPATNFGWWMAECAWDALF